MFSLTPKSHENASKKPSFGTWFGTQIGKLTILERSKKRMKNHTGNVTQVAPKRTSFSPGDRLKSLLWAHQNENNARGIDILSRLPKMVCKYLKMTSILTQLR